MELVREAGFKVEASAQITGPGEITIFLIGAPPGQPLQVLGQAIFKGPNPDLLVQLARQVPSLLMKIQAAQSGLAIAPAAMADRLRQ